jgi:hypothetical protein
MRNGTSSVKNKTKVHNSFRCFYHPTLKFLESCWIHFTNVLIWSTSSILRTMNTSPTLSGLHEIKMESIEKDTISITSSAKWLNLELQKRSKQARFFLVLITSFTILKWDLRKESQELLTYSPRRNSNASWKRMTLTNTRASIHFWL